MLSADILLDESVLAFILVQKSGKFHYHGESNTLITLYWYMSLQGILFVPSRLYLILVWGIVYS